MYTERNDIEQGIITSIINENSFCDVANYLSVKNFKEIKFQQIFSAAQNLYPLKSIDFITLKLELIKLYKENCDDAITFIFNHKGQLANKSSVKFWCLILIQIDIKNAFRNELTIWKDERKKLDQLVECAVIEEIFLNVTDDVDILVLIEKSMLYFEKHKMALELSKVQEFEENVCKKTIQIKKNISLEIALAQVFKIAESTPEVTHYCKKFADAIAYMTITNKIKSSYTAASNLL